MTKIAPRFSSRTAWLWPAAALGLLGCPNEELAPIGPCTVSGVFDKITQNGADEVDVLFVVDNSPSMKEEQENLAKNLPLLVEILASGEIKDAGGMVIQKFPPVKSLHLGVTTTSMGINGATVTTALASCKDLGDDGLLLNKPDTSVAGCTAAPAMKYLEYPAGTTTPQELGASFGCISRTGAGGCGFEQQLEAPLKALSPSSVTTFYKGAKGHGDVANKGFLREDSVIAIIIVSDEEDSSAPGSEIFNITGNTPEQSKRNNIRQHEMGGLLHPTKRYVDGFKKLRESNTDLLIFAGIVGVPKGVEGLVIGEGDEEQQDFDAILKRPEMKFTPELITVSGNEVWLPKPSCTNSNASPPSNAYPAARFVAVAKEFGKNGVIRSICDDDFSGALKGIIRKIANQLSGACLQRKLIRDPMTGLAPCGLVEYLKVGETKDKCVPGEGRRYLEDRKDDKGDKRVVCQLNQLAVKKTQAGCDAQAETEPVQCLAKNPNDPDAKENPRITDTLVGWYYDDFTQELKESNPGCNEQRIAFAVGAEQKKGSEIRFECLQPVFSVFEEPKGVDAVNKPCTPDTTQCSTTDIECTKNKGVCKTASNAEYTLACNERRVTCQIKCAEDSNCPDGWICDREGGAKEGICVNPTCPPQ